MDKFFSVLLNTEHQVPGLELLAVFIVLALVLPPLMNHLGKRRSGQDKRSSGKKR